MFRHEDLLAVMESRFDYASARAVLSEALSRAGIGGPRKEYNANELRAIAAGIALASQRAEGVISRLNEIADAMGVPHVDEKVEQPPTMEDVPAEIQEGEETPERPKGKKGRK